MEAYVQGRRVADWISVSALLAGYDVPEWAYPAAFSTFTLEVDGHFAQPGDVLVQELDGSITVARYDEVAKIQS